MGIGMMKDDPTRSAYLKRIASMRRTSCDRCGAKENLQWHHINRDWRDNTPSNLETLCATCHMKDHHEAGDILYPKTELQSRMEEEKVRP